MCFILRRMSSMTGCPTYVCLLVSLAVHSHHTLSGMYVLQVQQLHDDLYVYIMEELQQALLLLTAQPAASSDSSLAEQQHKQHRNVNKLLQLAAECEVSADLQRGHALYQQRLLLLPTAEVRDVCPTHSPQHNANHWYGLRTLHPFVHGFTAPKAPSRFRDD